MSNQIPIELIKKPILMCLKETFSQVQGIYLDKGTTLFETLDGVSASEASQAITPNSATIAAQVEHVRLYLDVLDDLMRTNEEKQINWREIWDTVGEVSPEEWEEEKLRLKQSHERVMATINSIDTWEGKYDVVSALAVLTHTAYHLGEVRQALGATKTN